MGWRRTTLRVALICYVIHRGAAKFFDVVWVSPAEGTTYIAGDTIIGKWTSTTPVVSPNFKLCEVTKEASAKCGTAIWPQAQELKDGYMVTITAPETSQESRYHLEMQDNFGNVFMSPVFGLGTPSGGKASIFTELSPDLTKYPEFQETPVGAPTAKASGTAKHPLGSKLSGSLGLATPTHATMTSPHIGMPPSSSTQPDVFVSRRPVPTAAFAVPLSAVAGIIIVAGLLILNNRRRLAKERKQEFKTLILSKHIEDSEIYGSAGEVQRTMCVLSRKGLSGYYDASELLPISFSRPEPRLATRSPFVPMVSASSSSTIFDDGLGYYYGEEPTVMRGKSLTDQYTAAGKKPRSEDYSQPASVIPSGFLPVRMSPAYVRSHSPELIRSLPVPPVQNALSMTSNGDVYDFITAEVKRS
ncbi:hypothetical protein AGABI2DRAFT_114692 [Agaricus bisporus var. bisporus H97]|uniref:hypothetical protein n=1 Tax=Agaricus bisporus var. bisporus (strain H97 / ATCC MYA-4626 / FGSC 10389) TaxID=936046 RepID=UPI00029F5528|nr:hypothetical protein AGABI2DRAFT_114692 [Agaricus bisporus var. bisporus H97]EKV51957.1 hypothetical protein AGABI2DRAFT_114692 [Agaricus bisporus var. bisporus H97]